MSECLGECEMRHYIGWDLGGAHVKTAWVGNGNVQEVWQAPCPLWRGMGMLEEAIAGILSRLPSGCVHGVTMTGEMADIFPDRHQGVQAILQVLVRLLGSTDLWVYEDPKFIPLSDINNLNTKHTASKNWKLPVQWLARSDQTALFIDIGSTTTDMVPLQHGRIICTGSNDRTRLEHGELLYMGVIRTPLMAVARQIPVEGKWQPLMAEHFATIADIYRIMGQLSPHADQAETADGGPKTRSASMMRLARMIGCDKNDVPDGTWIKLATVFRELQIQHLTLAAMRQISRMTTDSIDLVGAGVGRFLLPEIARRLDTRYHDFTDFIAHSRQISPFSPADCAPAAALALLLESQLRQ